jgi:hypothetical protein
MEAERAANVKRSFVKLRIHLTRVHGLQRRELSRRHDEDELTMNQQREAAKRKEAAITAEVNAVALAARSRRLDLDLRHARATTDTADRHRDGQADLLANLRAAADGETGRARQMDELVLAQAAERERLRGQQAREIRRMEASQQHAAPLQKLEEALALAVSERARLERAGAELGPHRTADWKWFYYILSLRLAMLNEDEATVLRSGGDGPVVRVD